MYDGTLRLFLAERVNVGFADNVSMVVAKHIHEVGTAVDGTIWQIQGWLKTWSETSIPRFQNGGCLSNKPKALKYIKITVQNQTIRIEETVKYLAILLENKLKFKVHMEYVKKKSPHFRECYQIWGDPDTSPSCCCFETLDRSCPNPLLYVLWR